MNSFAFEKGQGLGEEHLEALVEAQLAFSLVVRPKYFLAQGLDGLEERVNVETLAVILAGHIFEADFQVCLEELIRLTKPGHASQSAVLV